MSSWLSRHSLVPSNARNGGQWAAVFAAFVLAGAASAGVVVAPVVVGVLGALGVMALLLPSADRTFSLVLAVALLGYAFFDRSFAYLGVGPIRTGELCLALALLALLKQWRTVHLGPAGLTLVALMTWGALRTIPYADTFGMLAFRDAAVWGYGLIALSLAAVLTRARVCEAVAAYTRVVPWFVALVPALLLTSQLARNSLPAIPGTDVSVLHLKMGDAGVQLAAAGAVVIVGLYVPRRPLIYWTFWSIGALIVAALNRGGMLAVVVSLSAALLFSRATGAGLTTAWRLGLVLASILTLLLILDPRLETSSGRDLSPRQVLSNAASIIDSDTTGSGLQGTKNYRTAWWSTIWSYTVEGPHRWSGKGFGINLASDDGFQLFEDESLRSPHNSHMNFLARSGVPGLALWMMFLAILLVRLGYIVLSGDRAGPASRLAIFLFAALVAALVNTSFDPYLEGPQGAIWFWSLAGVAMWLITPGNTDRVDGLRAGASPREPGE